MGVYTELSQRQQEEVNALPLGYAFGKERFVEMMQNWGLDPERDIKKICTIGDGCYIQKKDVELMRQTFARHRTERAEAAAGVEGAAYIFQMFLRELKDHEYGYTRDPSDALEALGYTLEQVMADDKLRKDFERARKKIEKAKIF